VIGQAGASIFNEWFSNYWLVLVVKAGVVLGFFLVAPMVVGYA
jgi:general stress protein CsbA